MESARLQAPTNGLVTNEIVVTVTCRKCKKRLPFATKYDPTEDEKDYTTRVVILVRAIDPSTWFRVCVGRLVRAAEFEPSFPQTSLAFGDGIERDHWIADDA